MIMTTATLVALGAGLGGKILTNTILFTVPVLISGYITTRLGPLIKLKEEKIKFDRTDIDKAKSITVKFKIMDN